jgi:hypothetical protein
MEKTPNTLLFSAATVVAGMCIAYLIYNDGEPQGFGNKGKYLRNACQEI